jgi:hypothetical protein
VESLDEDITIEWSEGGMPCPVPACPSTSHVFNRLTNFTKHFKRLHQKKVVLFHCPKCGFKDSRRPKVVKHCERAHKGTDASVTAVYGNLVDNTKFIDPGEFRLPRRRIHVEERERTRLQRAESVPAQPLFALPEGYNARDHRFPHGGFKKS